MKKPRIAIIKASFYQEIVDSMLDECTKVLRENGVENITIVDVPGAFETPIMAKKLAESKEYDCIVTLGAVIKGETYHFELVANESARGLMNVMLSANIPIIFEILATYTYEQAVERSTGEHNKGREAALAALGILTSLQ